MARPLRFDDYERQRIPSYTDRVLSLAGPGFRASRVGQGAVEGLARISDHVPVYATFEVEYYPGGKVRDSTELREWRLEVHRLTVSLRWNDLHDRHGPAAAWAHKWGRILPHHVKPKLRVVFASEAVDGGSFTLKKMKTGWGSGAVGSSSTTSNKFDSLASTPLPTTPLGSCRASAAPLSAMLRSRAARGKAAAEAASPHKEGGDAAGRWPASRGNSHGSSIEGEDVLPANMISATWQHTSIAGRPKFVVEGAKRPIPLSIHVSTWSGEQLVPLGSARINLRHAVDRVLEPSASCQGASCLGASGTDVTDEASIVSAAGALDEAAVAMEEDLGWAGVVCGKVTCAMRVHAPARSIGSGGNLRSRTIRPELGSRQPSAPGVLSRARSALAAIGGGDGPSGGDASADDGPAASAKPRGPHGWDLLAPFRRSSERSAPQAAAAPVQSSRGEQPSAAKVEERESAARDVVEVEVEEVPVPVAVYRGKTAPT